MRLNNYISTNYSNYKTSKSKIFYPKNKKEIFKLIDFCSKKKIKILSIGSSLSWYDTIFNTNNIIINFKDYEKVFKIDKKKGILNVSSFYKISEILEKINKFGWTICSTPGNPDVTIGGCVSNDVHGKDTFKQGNFGENVIELEMILSNKKVIKCSRHKNSKIFRAALGGLGLLGIITQIKLKLKKKKKTYVTTNYTCRNYKELIKEIYRDRNRFDYIYGWIDFYSKKKQLGRGVIFKSKADNFSRAKYFNSGSLISQIKNLIKQIIFSFCSRFNFMKYLNFLFYKSFLFKSKNFKSSYKEVAWPLDINGINIKKCIYPNSFFEIQIIIDKKNLPDGLKNFILKCQNLKINSLITGIKMHKKNNNFLSFSNDGVSLNIHQIFNKKNEEVQKVKFRKLYQYILNKNYKIYLCKDFFLNKNTFKKNYKLSNEFLKIKKRIDKKELFRSDFLTRVK